MSKPIFITKTVSGIEELLEAVLAAPPEGYEFYGYVVDEKEPIITWCLEGYGAEPKQPPKIYTFKDQEEALNSDHDSSYQGPILKYGAKLLAQIYLGQHEWLAINPENSEECYYDSGWLGTEYGWAILDGYPVIQDIWTEPPESNQKPLTTDQMLFADPEKLKEYLEK